MRETLELPSGETVTPEDVFCFEGYPYRFVPLEHETYAFALSPLYWGGGDMDVPVRDRTDLTERWGPESRGVLTTEEWRAWLREARGDDRFGDEELDALERELIDGTDTGSTWTSISGLLARIRRALGSETR